ncbi:MAG: EF-hand domain-containing protein [Marinosulfonomonas sp.]|nr:EF-hand domain-containing protein [Marinosulfonomonas sp.]
MSCVFVDLPEFRELFKNLLITALIVSAAVMVPVTGPAQEEAVGIVPRLRLAAEADPEVSTYLRNIENQIERQRQDQAVRGLLQALYAAAPLGELTLEQIEQRVAKDQAKLRAGHIGRLLAWDLNGDGSISQSERKAFTGKEAVDVELLFTRGDTDDDGVVNLTELFSYAAAQALANKRKSGYEHLMLFDVDQDGAVS